MTPIALNDQRVDIDRRMMALPPNDPGLDPLWRELELVLARRHAVVVQMAKIPATHISDLRAKAVVLATLLRPADANDGIAIPEEEHVALALSLTDDIAQLLGS